MQHARAVIPRSFWVVGTLGLLWNLMGCVNFIMQMNPDTLARFPETAQALVASRPVWATLTFTLAVFGGLLGDVLLLLRKDWSVPILIAAFVGSIVTNLHTVEVSVSREMAIGSGMSIAIAAFIASYARQARYRGWFSPPARRT